jgi:hypothetical protein
MAFLSLGGGILEFAQGSQSPPRLAKGPPAALTGGIHGEGQEGEWVKSRGRRGVMGGS